MSKRHDALFDDVLKGIGAPEPAAPVAEPAPMPRDRGGARFLNRQNALADVGQREEKVLRWVDPASCVMWQRHNRDYALLTEESCRDLIDSIKAQGQQEFPAIVRRHPGPGADYEVICGARRHFAVSWLRANNYPQFRYLVEERELTDEEAFRLSDIENRDREDLSDLERARDYAQALELYYNGRQKTMAERLEVSEAWLSRYLQLARLPAGIIEAWPSPRELKELHARALKPIISDPRCEHRVMAEAGAIAAEQRAARAEGGEGVPVARVLARLKAAAADAAPKRAAARPLVFRRNLHESGISVAQKGRTVRMEFDTNLSEAALRANFDAFLKHRFPKE